MIYPQIVDVAGGRVNVDRFWVRVERGEGCWTWTGARQRRQNGALSYGLAPLGRRGAYGLAHRVAHELTHGPIPSGLVVCHTCDNPICVRPDHLFLGTQADNLADMRRKGRAHFNRFPTGVTHPKAKVTPEIVLEIRRLWDDGGLSAAKIGERFGIHAATVHKIATRQTWTHVSPPQFSASLASANAPELIARDAARPRGVRRRGRVLEVACA